ncbi:hypothetical protein RRG08_021634 [Elysia crispata]|uniref:Uncharacterized protein n=1 Tax=Elysia crispata TaxID=231223 RepID=A0AAE0XDT2_9GAST|nr:hypothetical protein RRG08_021634 [Elysia crispata]
MWLSQLKETTSHGEQFTNCYQLSSVIGSLGPSVVFGRKGILLIFGIFLAYQTQSVRLKGKQVNDSRFVGMSTYDVVDSTASWYLLQDNSGTARLHHDASNGMRRNGASKIEIFKCIGWNFENEPLLSHTYSVLSRGDPAHTISLTHQQLYIITTVFHLRPLASGISYGVCRQQPGLEEIKRESWFLQEWGADVTSRGQTQFVLCFPDNIQHRNRARLSNMTVEDLRQVGDLREEIMAISQNILPADILNKLCGSVFPAVKSTHSVAMLTKVRRCFCVIFLTTCDKQSKCGGSEPGGQPVPE